MMQDGTLDRDFPRYGRTPMARAHADGGLRATRWKRWTTCLVVGWLCTGILPAQAQTSDPTLTETPETQYTSAAASDLAAMVTQLQGSPVKIYEYVRNTFSVASYHGSRSGSINTFLGQRGNDVDLASTVIAMFRAAQIPARYVVGTIQVPAATLTNWMGVTDPNLAVSVLKDQGMQGVVAPSNPSSVQFEHVWVEALVPYDEYRGVPSGTGATCATPQPACHWVALDPSFKVSAYPIEPIDVSTTVAFNYTAYYNAMVNQDPLQMNKNPLDIFEAQILTYLQANQPGKTLEDVAYAGQILAENNQILPASLPYQVTSTVRRYNSIADHDQAVPKTEPKKWAKTLTLSIPGQLSTPPILLATLATQRLTVTFVNCGTSCGVQAQVRLGGVSLVTGIPAGSASQLEIDLAMDGPPSINGSADNTLTAQYSNLAVGGYYLIGTGGDSSNWSQVHRAATQLLAANRQYVIVKNPNDPKGTTYGVPYLDTNGNGQWDVSDQPLINNSQAMDDLTGGLLYVAMTQYFAKAHDTLSRLTALTHTTAPIPGWIGVVSSTNDVEYVDGTAFSILPGGLLIDMKGMYQEGFWRIDAANIYSNSTFQLLTHVWSSLEHEIWQELTGYDAISTVRGIQRALTDPTTALLDIKDAASLYAAYTAFNFTSTSPFAYAVAQPTGWTDKNGYYYCNTCSPAAPGNFEYFTKTVSPSSPTYQKNLTMRGPAFPQVNTFQYQLANLDFQIQFPTGGPYSCGGLSASWGSSSWSFPGPSCIDAFNGFPGGFWNWYQNYVRKGYWGPWSADEWNYMDENLGFSAGSQVYRLSTAAVNKPNVNTVGSIRNAILVNTQPGVARWEFLVPSNNVVISTTNQSFEVSIQMGYDESVSPERLSTMGMTIANDYLQAGGGYVSATTPLQQNTTDGTLFNNTQFTDKNLITQVNNDVLRTPSTIDPVSTVTGNNYHDETDVVLKGRGLDLAFTRTYNSGPSSNTGGLPMGFGWTHSFAGYLRSNDYGRFPNYPAAQAPENSNNRTSSITFVDERGGEYNFLVDDMTLVNGSPTWTVTPTQGQFATLALNQPVAGSYTVTFPNGVIYTFQAPAPNTDLRVPGVKARLVSIQDPYGNQISLTYDGSGKLTTVTDGLVSGRGLSFAYTADGHLQTLTVSAQTGTSRVWQYAYDGAGNLITVTNPLSAVMTYQYQPGTHNLTAVILPQDRNGDGVGDVKTTFVYYQNQKTFSYANTLGQTEYLDYDLYAKRTRVTDPLGFVRDYWYDKDGHLTQLEEADKALLLFSYDAATGLRSKKSDGLGYATTYTYDANGNVISETDALGKSIQYQYGPYGCGGMPLDQPTQITDKNGNVRTFSYFCTTDSTNGAVKGKLQRMAVRMGGTIVPLEDRTYYYPGGQFQTRTEYLSATDPTQTRVTTFTYDGPGLNLVRRDVTGSGQTSSLLLQPDAWNRVQISTQLRRTSATNPTQLSLTTTYGYDDLDRVISVIDPLGTRRQSVYDQNGKVIQRWEVFKKTDGTYEPARIISTRTYDAADRLIMDTDILGASTTYQYDAAGHHTQVTDANGHSTKYEYDPMGRRTATVDANGNRSTLTYDLAGHVMQSTDPTGNTTRFLYDPLGRLTTVIDPQGNQTQYSYDPNGNRLTMKDANAVFSLQPTNVDGATVSYRYDELNRLVLVKDALNHTTAYTYDLVGNRTSVTDGKGQTTRFVYDNLGRLVTVIDPLIETPTDKVVTYTYDEAGNVLTKTSRRGVMTQYTYDGLNRLTAAQYFINGQQTDQETFGYDLHGDLITVTNQAVTYQYTYDRKHRRLSKTDQRYAKSLVYTYDAVGNPLTKTDYQGDVTTYQYDDANRLVSLRNPQYVEVSYQYDPAGRLLNRMVSNGAVTSYLYDGAGRLSSLSNRTGNGSVVNGYGYSRDPVGNITAITDPTGTVTYTYDPLSRLRTVTAPDATQNATYTYDEVGNRTLATFGSGPTAATTAYVYNAGNRLLELHQNNSAGTLLQSLSYDDDGNVTNRWLSASPTNLTQTFTLDAKNRIIATTGTGQSPLAYQYDPSDYRIQKTGDVNSASYLLEGEHVETILSSHLNAQFLRGVVIDEVVSGYLYNDQTAQWNNYTFHHDHLTSVSGLSSHDGRVVQTATYGPFGEPLTSIGAACTVEQYTGREREPETGLYYYRARYYDPTLGRFLTEDPLGFAAGVNFYAYANNNPIDANDPTGDFAMQAAGFAVGGVGGLLVQGGIDLARGEISSFAQYAGAFMGGGAGGTAAVTCGVVCAGAAAGAASNLTIQAINGNGLSPTSFFLDSGIGAVTGGVAGKAVPAAFGWVSTNLKGDIGEWLSALGLTLTGQGIREIHAPNGVGRSTYDFLLDSGAFVESKFGTSPLSGPQRLGIEQGLEVDVHYWSYDRVSGIAASGPVAGGIGGGDAPGGGYVLYPNKPNLNMMRSVYAK